MEPVSYWPVELVLNSTIIYMILNSKNVYEILFLVLALSIHVKRQYDNIELIRDTSTKKSVLFHVSILTLAGLCVWIIRTSTWPLPVFISVIVGIMYYKFTVDFVNDSGKQFTLFDPKIDIPQTIISGVFSMIAINNQNPVSILWLCDFVYHILEYCLLNK